jgi:hypothetical protein
MTAYRTLLQKARKRPWRSTRLNGNSAHAAVRGGMAAHKVHPRRISSIGSNLPSHPSTSTVLLRRTCAASSPSLWIALITPVLPVPLIMTRLPVVIALRLRSYVIMVFSPL